jgi:hypothetical protein
VQELDIYRTDLAEATVRLSFIRWFSKRSSRGSAVSKPGRGLSSTHLTRGTAVDRSAMFKSSASGDQYASSFILCRSSKRHEEP